MRAEDQLQYRPVTVCLLHGVTVSVRFLEHDDGELLADFYKEIPPEDQVFFNPHPLTAESARQMAAAVHYPYFLCLVMEAASGDIIGYCWAMWNDDDSDVSTAGICIRRAFQGVGAGKALMRRLTQIVAEIGPPVMRVGVCKNDRRGVSFLKRMGFASVGEQIRATDGALEYCMELSIS